MLHTAHAFPVFWISSRKHILALIFILIASTKIVRREYVHARDQVLIVVVLLCALFSHPVYGLWFLWAFFTIYQFQGKKFFVSQKLLTLLLPLISIGVLLLNYSLYSAKKTNAPSYTGIDVPYSLEVILEIFNIYGQYVLNLLRLNGNAVFYEVTNMFNLIGAVILVILFIFLVKTKNNKININLAVLLIFVSATYTFFPLGTYVQNTYALFFNACVLLIIVLAINELLKTSKQHQRIINFSLACYLAFNVFYTHNYIGMLQNNLSYIEHNKNLYRVPMISADFVRLKVHEMFVLCDHRSKSFFEDTMPEMLYLKEELLRDKLLLQRNGAGSVYDAYYQFLLYMDKHETMNLEVRKEIIEKICLDHIIYCNYYSGRNYQKLEDVNKADQFHEKSLLQFINIVKARKEESFKEYYAQRWCEIGGGLVAYSTKNKNIVKLQNKLITLLEEQDLLEILVCIKKQGSNNVEIKMKPYENLEKVINLNK